MNLTVADLVQRFDTGEIRLPLMQRDYVWRPKKVTALLDSLYRSWPIGSFYVWRTQDDHPTKVRVGMSPQRRLDGFSGFLLDGQQRLTSLSLAIQGEAEAELPQRAFFDLENQVFYLGTMKRTITKRIAAADPLIVPLSDIVLASSDGETDHNAIERIIQSLREQGRLGKGTQKEVEYRTRLHRLATILRRAALCEEFTDDQEEHAFELFSRLNKGGTSLSTGDVTAARLASAATKKIVEPMRAVVAERELRALGINFVFLVRTLVTVHRGNCSFSKLPRNWADDTGEVESSWRRTEQALRATIQFVKNDVGWTTRRWLPSTMALIPVVYLLANSSTATLRGKDAELIKRYLLISGLRSLFRGSTETTVNFYVNAIRNAGNRADRTRLARALVERIPRNRLYRIRAEDVRSTSGLYSSLMQIYLAYLYSKDAKSWPSGRSLREVLHDGLTNDPLAVHHIVPKKFMQDRDFPLDRLNTVGNYAILSQDDNAALADRDPFDVWRSLKTNQKEWASAQLCFTAREDLLKAYEEFIDFRADKLADQLNEFVGLGERRTPPRTMSAAAGD
jgi:hypothetical protein